MATGQRSKEVRGIDKFALLKQHFGHSEFRRGQEELIEALLAGQDVLGVMPTGAGKSICYQLPALLLPGLTLVVSPLISLMKDQVAALSQAGVAAAFLNSSLTVGQRREVLRRAREQAYRILYVAPERLEAEDFLDFSREADVSLLAVDEAHCVSQWGQDFRPSYLNISEFVRQLPRRPVLGAFTATATSVVKDDIERLLLLRQPLRITTGFDRPNLYFEVAHPKSKEHFLRNFVTRRPDQSGIVYCATRKAVESVCHSLCQDGVTATRYHAGLSDEERRQNQEDFVYDRARVMVATNAFGMGIDKSNVSFVAHYNMPKNIESYYQEAGRAGRDGEKARCVLLFAPGDVTTARFLINHAEENNSLSPEEQQEVRQRDLQRLDQMVSYCKTTGCLRAQLLRYFGEEKAQRCGNCGNCDALLEEQDITVEAQKILSGVARVERKYASGLGLTLVVRMLHGSREQRVLQLGLDALPTYGALREVDRSQIRVYLDHLLDEGYLTLTGDDYPVLRLTERARAVLFEGAQVLCARRRPAASERVGRSRKGAPPPPLQADEGLLAALKALRLRLALEARVPAYHIFTNATLAEMADRQPHSIDQLMQVSGVGNVKAGRYGRAFLEEIARWREEAGEEA